MRTHTSARCTLEPQVEAHAQEMFEVLSDPAIYEFERVPPPSVERLAAGYKRRESRQSDDGTEKWLNWVVRVNSGELAGYIQATVLPSGNSYIGYEFASRFWRQGLASACIRAASTELADHYAVHTLVAVVKAANYRSLGLLRRLGFKEATVEQASHFEAEHDEVVFLAAAGVAHAA
jgi:ribosomal-protein-alanine N-acetyltransferase